jgi:prepilin-type N-terminal cleavage/methylation domain-containing protein
MKGTIMKTVLPRILFSRRGVSIIELLAVLFIFGIMISLSVPSFSNLSNQSKVRTSSRAIVSILRTAQQYAIARNAVYITDFDKPTGTITIIDSNGCSTGKTFCLPRGIYFDKTLDDIQFFPTGRAIKVGGGAAINSIVITSKKKPAIADKITVLAVTGRIKLKTNQDNP